MNGPGVSAPFQLWSGALLSLTEPSLLKIVEAGSFNNWDASMVIFFFFRMGLSLSPVFFLTLLLMKQFGCTCFELLVCGRFEEAAEVLQALVTVPDVVDSSGVSHSSTPPGVEVNMVCAELAIGVTGRAVWGAERHPGSHIALHNAGIAMLMDGSPARAAGYLEAALEVEPACYVSWGALAVCYFRLGRAQDGARCHAIAGDLVPSRGLPTMDQFVQNDIGNGAVALLAKARGLRRDADGAEAATDAGAVVAVAGAAVLAPAELRARARQLEARAAACEPGPDPRENQAITIAQLLCGHHDRVLKEPTPGSEAARPVEPSGSAAQAAPAEETGPPVEQVGAAEMATGAEQGGPERPAGSPALPAPSVARKASAPSWPAADIAGPSVADLNNRAVALMVALRFEEAAEVLDQAEVIGGTTRATLVNRGNLLRMQGKLKEALETFQTCTAAHPVYAPAWHGCGLVHARKGDWQAAQEALEAAVASDPVASHARDALAWIKKKRADCKERHD